MKQIVEFICETCKKPTRRYANHNDKVKRVCSTPCLKVMNLRWRMEWGSKKSASNTRREPYAG